MKKHKWGILGPGKIARKFASDLKLLPNAQLYGVASRSLDRAQSFSEEFGAEKFYGNYGELINDPEIDIVYIATPHTFHSELSLQCLRNKKAVLCEKPLGVELNEVSKMIEVAKEEKVFLMEAIWTSCLPQFTYVKELVKSGEYGRVNLIKSDFGFKATYNPEGRLFNKELGGGSLLDIGIYPVFCAASLLGYSEDMKASAIISETGVDEQTHAILKYKNGGMALLSATLVNDTATESYIYCEEATIRINGRWHEPSSVDLITRNGIVNKDFQTQGFGYQFEASEAMRCLEKDLLESPEMGWELTQIIARQIEDIKKEIKLEYK